jgi:NADH-quinone oxidoreductase subunit E
MVSVGQHPNIELLTYSEVEEVSGYVGNFKIKVRRKARYIDEDKCTGCGQCIERCPVQFKPIDGRIVKRLPAEEVEIDPELKASVDEAIEHHEHERAPLISVLQDINIDRGYLPEDVLKYLSQRLGIPVARVYHVATFYSAFSLVPRGEHLIKVCVGTSCHVRGAARILEALENRLEIKAGQTTEDRAFTLETVNCLGACALSPVIVIDSKYYGDMSLTKVDKLIDQYYKVGAKANAT